MSFILDGCYMWTGMGWEACFSSDLQAFSQCNSIHWKSWGLEKGTLWHQCWAKRRWWWQQRWALLWSVYSLVHQWSSNWKWMHQNRLLQHHNFELCLAVPAGFTVKAKIPDLVPDPALHLPWAELFIVGGAVARVNFPTARAEYYLCICPKVASVKSFKVARQRALPRWIIRGDISGRIPAWGFATLRTLHCSIMKVNISLMSLHQVFALKPLYWMLSQTELTFMNQ